MRAASAPRDFEFFQVFGEEQVDGAGIEEIQEGALLWSRVLLLPKPALQKWRGRGGGSLSGGGCTSICAAPAA